MNKILVAILIAVVIVAVVIIFTDKKEETKTMEETQEYQGAVPEGYNETHFRKTGVTIPNG